MSRKNVKNEHHQVGQFIVRLTDNHGDQSAGRVAGRSGETECLDKFDFKSLELIDEVLVEVRRLNAPRTYSRVIQLNFAACTALH